MSEPVGQISSKRFLETIKAMRQRQQHCCWWLQGEQSRRNFKNSNCRLKAWSWCRDKGSVNTWCQVTDCSRQRWGRKLNVWGTLTQLLNFLSQRKFVPLLSRGFFFIPWFLSVNLFLFSFFSWRNFPVSSICCTVTQIRSWMEECRPGAV